MRTELRTTPCRSCGQPMRWATSEKGRRIPLDPEPYTGDSPRGLFVLRDRDKPTPTAIAATPDSFPGEPLYRSHFAACPSAREHRRSAA